MKNDTRTRNSKWILPEKRPPNSSNQREAAGLLIQNTETLHRQITENLLISFGEAEKFKQLSDTNQNRIEK